MVAAVGGLWVDFAQATTDSGPYEVVYKVTSPAGPYATGVGEYSIAVMPMQTTYYRFQWEGDANYQAADPSDVVPVQVKPSLGKPSCPSSVKKSGHKFTVSGSVKPGAAVSPAVKIKAYRYNGHGYYRLQDLQQHRLGHEVQGQHQDQQDRQVQVQGDVRRRTRSSPPTRQPTSRVLKIKN